MSREVNKSGESTPSDNVEMAGETDEGFVQIESKKKPNSKKGSGSKANKKPDTAVAVSDGDRLVQTPGTQPTVEMSSGDNPTMMKEVSGGTDSGEAAVFDEVGGGQAGNAGGGWWGGFGDLVQAAKSTAAKVGSAAGAALNELTKDDEEAQEGVEEVEEGWESTGDAEVASVKSRDSGGAPRSPTDQSGSWGLGGWLQVAKDKTVAGAGAAVGVFDLVRRDLTEFTQETGSAVTSTASRLKDRLHITDGVSSVLNAVSGAFYIPPEDEGEEAILVTDSDALVLGRFEKDMHDLRRDSATYLTDPEDATAFAGWRAKFDLSAKQQEMSELLVKLKELRDNYARCVPAKASHTEFWLRYFYKVEQLHTAEEKRKEMKKRAEEAVAAAASDAGKETSDWDDDVM